MIRVFVIVGTQQESLRTHHARALFVCQENYAKIANIGAVLARSFSLFQSKEFARFRSAAIVFAHRARGSHSADRKQIRCERRRPYFLPRTASLLSRQN